MFNESQKEESTASCTFPYQPIALDKHVASGRMGTKIDYSRNLLPVPPDGNSFALHRVNEWQYLQNRGAGDYCCTMSEPDKFQDAVNRLLEKRDVESIRQTMQVHEDVFKYQVKELHRLYNVQKILMDDLKRELKPNRSWGNAASSNTNNFPFTFLEQSTTQNTSGFNFHLHRLKEEQRSSRERSGSSSGDNMRLSRGFDLEKPAEEDKSTGVSAIEEEQAGPSSRIVPRSENDKVFMNFSDEDSEVELTLSIGGTLSKKKQSKSSSHHLYKEIRELDSSASFKSERGEHCSDPATPMSSSSATFDQETNRSHWLFQGLKLK